MPLTSISPLVWRVESSRCDKVLRKSCEPQALVAGTWAEIRTNTWVGIHESVRGSLANCVVFRPDYIVDSRLGIGRFRDPLGEDNEQLQAGWVCRHDLAAACRLAIEKKGIDFEVLHVVGTANAEKTCNVARTREVLGLEFSGQLDHYR